MKKLIIYALTVFTLVILLSTVALYTFHPYEKPQQFAVHHEPDTIVIETTSYNVSIDKEHIDFQITYDGILLVDHAHWVIYNKQGVGFRSDFTEEREVYDKTKNGIPTVEGYCVPKIWDGISSNATVRFRLECYQEKIKLTTWFTHNAESETTKFQSLHIKLFLNKNIFTNFWFSELNNGELTQRGTFYSEHPKWPLGSGFYGCLGKNYGIWIVPELSPLSYNGFELGCPYVNLVRGASIEDYKDGPVMWFSYIMVQEGFEAEVKGGKTIVNGYELWIYPSHQDIRNVVLFKKAVNMPRMLAWMISLSILGLGATGIVVILESRLKSKKEISLLATLGFLFILILSASLCLILFADALWAGLRGWLILALITLTVSFGLADLIKPVFIKKESLFLLAYSILGVFSTCLALTFLVIMI